MRDATSTVLAGAVPRSETPPRLRVNPYLPAPCTLERTGSADDALVRTTGAYRFRVATSPFETNVITITSS